MTQVPNPQYVGAPARMADGRLFTDYRRSNVLLPAYKNVPWADWDRIQRMQRLGVARIQNDRAQSTMMAGSSNCVDTMVPELSKWQYAWNGGQQLLAQPVGIGAGRNPLPGRVGMDPDALAAAAFPLDMLHGSYNATSANVPIRHAVVDRPVLPPRYNKYSQPYGS
jgi:hypothetical protein